MIESPTTKSDLSVWCILGWSVRLRKRSRVTAVVTVSLLAILCFCDAIGIAQAQQNLPPHINSQSSLGSAGSPTELSQQIARRVAFTARFEHNSAKMQDHEEERIRAWSTNLNAPWVTVRSFGPGTGDGFRLALARARFVAFPLRSGYRGRIEVEVDESRTLDIVEVLVPQEASP